MSLAYSEVIKMKKEDVIKTIEEKQRELVDLRFQLVANKLKDIKSVSKTKKEIARLKTFLSSQKDGE